MYSTFLLNKGIVFFISKPILGDPQLLNYVFTIWWCWSWAATYSVQCFLNFNFAVTRSLCLIPTSASTLRKKKVQKLSRRYLFKRYTFVPKGVLLRYQYAPFRYKSVPFEKVPPQWQLLYLFFWVTYFCVKFLCV